MGGFEPELAGEGGQDAGLVFGLGGQQRGGTVRLQVQDGPQLGQDVQAVQAQVVGGPAGAQGGGQVAVAGLVDPLDPAAQPGDGLLAVAGGEFPPGGRRAGLVAAGILTGTGAGGQAGEQRGQGGVVRGFAGVEPGELLTAGGELVGTGR